MREDSNQKCSLFRFDGNMISMLNVGDTFIEPISFTQDNVNLFMQLTGDKNPIHVNQDVARASGYKDILVHGMLVACMFGGVLGTKFPGAHTVNLSRSLVFIRPVFVGETYFMHFKITGIDFEQHIGEIKCRLKDSGGRICVDCSTKVKNEVVFVWK